MTVHLIEKDIHRGAPVRTGIGMNLKMQMMPGAVAGIIRQADLLPLEYLGADIAEFRRDAVLGEVEINMVGYRFGGVILQ